MKIDKVLWASSAAYSDFWDVNSMIHKKFMDIDCTLLLYGKKNDCELSEEFGKIIECDFEDGAQKIPQLIWNKWYHTQSEPETTWLIGDIDQIPLQREHFVENIKDVPSDNYAHLAEDAFTTEWKNTRERLVGHYHVAKGKVFAEALDLDKSSLIEQVKDMENLSQSERKPMWAYEEWYTADLIKKNNFLGRFSGFSRSPKIKICRSSNCAHKDELFNELTYIDIHCPRPYSDHKKTIDNILTKAWGELY